MSGGEQSDLQRSGVEDLENLITRLERAAEQLRSGEISADVAAKKRPPVVCAMLRSVVGSGGTGIERSSVPVPTESAPFGVPSATV